MPANDSVPQASPGDGPRSVPADPIGADGPDLTAAEQERHSIYLLLAMTLVFEAWGLDPSRREQALAYAAAAPGRVFPDYLGHNVGALLVAPDGTILDFAMNRNVALNSTLEHAEVRTVRHAIDAANAAAGPGGATPWSFGALLQDHRIYVTLEPCSQCSGIMDLARIGTVIYGQDDPGQCGIAHALHALRHRPGALPAPLPVRAVFFPFWRDLAEAYGRFLAAVPAGGRSGVTSFLETVAAFRIFAAAAEAFDGFRIAHPANSPTLAAARSFRARHPADPVVSLLRS